jgi:tripartite-type tricarboxylate transporter receptor subunit TctC
MIKIIQSLLLAAITSTVVAAETVKVYWPFSAASPQAVMIRELLISANENQNKYKFVFTLQQGAGGSVAANAVQKDSNLSLLASTSSFFIRPELYENSHNVSDFSMISTVCLGQPLGLLSKNNNLLNIAEKEFTIGIIPGSVTSLVAIALMENNKEFSLRLVPFKSTPAATASMLGGHIDSNIDFVGKLTVNKLSDNTSVVGITGHQDKGKYQTFESLGILGLTEIVNDYFIFAPNSVNESVKKELNEILNKSINNKVTEICQDAFGDTYQLPYQEATQFQKTKEDIWKRITSTIEKF